MKTLHLVILTGFGIAIVVIFGASYFFPFTTQETLNIGTNDLDLSNSTTENPLDIRAEVILEKDTLVSCIRKCDIPPTPHLVLMSEKGAQFVGYQVCDGASCKKDSLSNSISVHLLQVPQNYTGVVSLDTGDINLGNLPWSVGDPVRILVKTFPVTLQPNDTVIREPEKTMTVDFGESKIIGNNIVNTSIAENHIVNTKNNNLFGVVGLMYYYGGGPCGVGVCPLNTFNLKMNSNHTAYLLGYNICDGNSCIVKNDLSILLPLNVIGTPNYKFIALPENPQWQHEDVFHIQVEVSSIPDNKTAIWTDLGNSTIIH